jgi:hypothetical protein
MVYMIPCAALTNASLFPKLEAQYTTTVRKAGLSAVEHMII